MQRLIRPLDSLEEEINSLAPKQGPPAQKKLVESFKMNHSLDMSTTIMSAHLKQRPGDLKPRLQISYFGDSQLLLLKFCQGTRNWKFKRLTKAIISKEQFNAPV